MLSVIGAGTIRVLKDAGPPRATGAAAALAASPALSPLED
jgi:hypothetical protein